MCIAFLIRKNNHNLKYRTLVLLGMLYSTVCPEALYSPRNGPADQNNMLGRRIFLVLLCSRQREAGQQGRQLEGYCPCPDMRTGVCLIQRQMDSQLLSQSPVLLCPGSSSGEKTPEDQVRVASPKPLLFCWPPT